MKCPKCNSECVRDEVDIGVGTQYGPWVCMECGWREPPPDLSGLRFIDENTIDASFEEMQERAGKDLS
jgi:hypothetical protein